MTEEKLKVEKEIRGLFDATLFLKAVHAGIEIVGGSLLFIARPENIIGIVNFFIRDEITEEPHNIILNYISHSAHYFASSSKTFTALYLLSHGLVNAFIVMSLYKQKLWAYPVSLIILGFFGLYQMYEFIYTHSSGLLMLTILDIIVMILVWHEYGVVKGKRNVI